MRLSLKAKVLSLAVLPVLLFALVISLTTLFILQASAQRGG
jgi:methyl-accepting chemotaxis protein